MRASWVVPRRQETRLAYQKSEKMSSKLAATLEIGPKSRSRAGGPPLPVRYGYTQARRVRQYCSLLVYCWGERRWGRGLGAGGRLRASWRMLRRQETRLACAKSPEKMGTQLPTDRAPPPKLSPPTCSQAAYHAHGRQIACILGVSWVTCRWPT